MRKLGLWRALMALRFEQGIMVLLTAVIAVSAVVQALSVTEQARLFAEAEARAREREQPKLLVTQSRYEFVDKEALADGTWEEHADGTWQEITLEDLWPTKTFRAVRATNASVFDVTITEIFFEFSFPIEAAGSAESGQVRFAFHSASEHPEMLQSDQLPRRLQPGETLSVVYDEAGVTDALADYPGVKPWSVRPTCVDSLGNQHVGVRRSSWTDL